MVTVLRWGVLGTAKIAIDHVIPAMLGAANGEVTAIASRTAGTAEEVGARFGIPHRFAHYEEMLASDVIDAVYIPLPNHLHRQWAIAAAAAGKHVLCEKPLALTSNEAQEMVDACRDAGVVLAEAFMYRHHPSWVAVQDLAASGRIGELCAVHTAFGYFNDDPANIRNRVECGGGALMDVGCYAIDLSRMLFGAEPSDVQAVIRRDPRFGTDIVTSAILSFGLGHSLFTVSTQLEDVQHVELLGTSGRIVVDVPFNIPPDWEAQVSVVAGGDPPTAPDVEVLTFAPVDQYTLQAEAFAATVLDGIPPARPVEEAVANMRVLERIVAAAEA